MPGMGVLFVVVGILVAVFIPRMLSRADEAGRARSEDDESTQDSGSPATG